MPNSHRCRRCYNVFVNESKYGKICPDCKLDNNYERFYTKNTEEQFRENIAMRAFPHFTQSVDDDFFYSLSDDERLSVLADIVLAFHSRKKRG